MLPITSRTHQLSAVFITTSSLLFALAAGTLAMRLYTKIYPALVLGWDDAFIIFGFVSSHPINPSHHQTSAEEQKKAESPSPLKKPEKNVTLTTHSFVICSSPQSSTGPS